MKPKKPEPTLGLPVDPEDMVCVNQPNRFEGIPDEKIAARKNSTSRRRSEPKLFIFRSTSSHSIGNSIGLGASSHDGLKSRSSHGNEEDSVSSGGKQTNSRISGVRTRLDDLRKLFERPLTQSQTAALEDVIVNATKVNFKNRIAAGPKEAVS